MAIGPLYSLSTKLMYPSPAAPSSFAQLFNLSKKLLGFAAVPSTIIPLTLKFFSIRLLNILKSDLLKTSVKSLINNGFLKSGLSEP